MITEREHHGHREAPTVPSRSVMVDVGETTGALVVTATEEFNGAEVEIHPVGDPAHRTHVWVLPREGRDAVTFAAVFPRLAIGDYAVLAPDGSLHEVLTIPPNAVTHSHWV